MGRQDNQPHVEVVLKKSKIQLKILKKSFSVSLYGFYTRATTMERKNYLSGTFGNQHVFQSLNMQLICFIWVSFTLMDLDEL